MKTKKELLSIWKNKEKNNISLREYEKLTLQENSLLFNEILNINERRDLKNE